MLGLLLKFAKEWLAPVFRIRDILGSSFCPETPEVFRDLPQCLQANVGQGVKQKIIASIQQLLDASKRSRLEGRVNFLNYALE
jgi:hypothetical protein